MPSPTLKIVSGAAVDLDTLRTGFNRGFSDYKYGTQFDHAGFERFLNRAGIDPARSAVLLAQEDGVWQGAGVALLALDENEGWCGGLAVSPEYRGQGAARGLMDAIEAAARQAAIEQLWLEVLDWNEAAYRLYQRLGYRTVRKLLIWERPPGPVTALPGETLRALTVPALLDEMARWSRPRPAWQRRLNYLRRLSTGVHGYALLGSNGMPAVVGLCQHNLHGRTGESLHLLDLAAAPGEEMPTKVNAFLAALALQYPEARMLLVNEPAESRLNTVLESQGFQITDQQFEMVMDLSP